MLSSHPGYFEHEFSGSAEGFDYYSNALDIDFLNQVLDLQNTLASLTASIDDGGQNLTVHLGDICFKVSGFRMVTFSHSDLLCATA